MTIKRLGFNVEHKLSESAFDLSENNSLKVIILNKIIESATNSASPSGSVLTDIPKELSLFLDNVYNELSVILKIFLNVINLIRKLKELFSHCTIHYPR